MMDKQQNNDNIQELARKARNQYAKAWRERNPEKQRAIVNRYWAKKAAQMQEQAETTDHKEDE